MFQNKNTNFYKPLIAASLAFSLCTLQARVITGTTDLTITQISDITELGDGTMIGLYLHETSGQSDFNLTLAGNARILPVVSVNNNAYGILVETNSTTNFISNNFQTITVENAKADAKYQAYVYKNSSLSNVTFLSTGLVAGRQDERSCTFGVYSNLVGARYDFGKNTIAGANSQGQGSVDGANAYGVVVKKDATFEGKLSFSPILGGSISDANRSGGNAIGIKGGNGANLVLKDFSASFTRFEAGVNNKGKNGEVIGIYADGDFGISAIGTGKINLSSLALSQDALIIKNSSTGTLTLSSGVDIVYNKQGSNSIVNAVISDTAGGKYSFGSGGAQKVGTLIQAVNNAPLVGIAFAPSATNPLVLEGVLGVSGGNGNAGNGGSAVGINIDATRSNATLELNRSLLLQVSGGNGAKSARAGNAGGDVVGLEFVGNSTNNITVQGGNLSIILKAGFASDGTTSASAFALKNTGNTVFSNGASLSTLGSLGEKISIDGSYGIYNASSASYEFGALTSFEVTPTAGNAYGVVLSSKMDMQSGNANFTVKSSTADAYAILADRGVATFSANANLEFDVNSTVGKAVGITVRNDSSLTLNGRGTVKLKVGDTSTKEAYGFRLEGGNYYGNFSFDGRDSYIKSGANGVSYGVYAVRSNELESTTLTFADNALASTSGKVYTLYNAGNLTLKKSAKIIQGTDSSGREKINLYVGASSTLNVTLGEGSKTLFQADKAIAGEGKVNLVLQKNAGAKFDGNSTAISANTNITINGGGALVFSNSAFDTSKTINLVFSGTQSEFGKVLFGDEAGEIDNASGEYGVFLLAGEDQKSVNMRFASRGLKTRTLTIKEMNLNNSGFVLAAKGGTTQSDKVVIEGTTNTSATPQTPLNNNIYIVVDKYATDCKNVVTLATVASGSEDKVIFNSLTENNQETNTAIYQGFSRGLIKIKREANENGGAKYTSTLQAGDVEINPEFISPTAAALSASLTLFSANLNSLNKRMGELRDSDFSHGAWVRIFFGEQTSDFGAKQNMAYATLQAGYDYNFAFKDGNDYLGVALSYTQGIGDQVAPSFKITPPPIDITVAGPSSTNVDGVEVALYNSYIHQSGLYSDSIVKLGYYLSDINMYQQLQTYKVNNLAAALSQEVGYKFALDEDKEWLITPQGEFSYGYMQGSDFTQYTLTGESMDAKQEAISLLRSRIGVAWGYDFAHLFQKSEVKASIYLGTYYVYDYFVGGDTTLSTIVNGKNASYQYNAYQGGSRFVINLGTNIKVKDIAQIYFDFEKSFGGSIQTNYQINFGARIGLGEKTPKEKRGL